MDAAAALKDGEGAWTELVEGRGKLAAVERKEGVERATAEGVRVRSLRMGHAGWAGGWRWAWERGGCCGPGDGPGGPEGGGEA